ncbi:putative Transmembrane protein [Quillaja saponaria]|uniref:Transmembrane protein n=1 Tax=Quillaja saponaria TaxID=32244 RepID=A0AAD7VIQ6_QUISA|nr:putative Transmembrane protein [Quillaja saponaria]
MELKYSSITTFFFTFLIIFSILYFSTGRSLDSEIYEIDYRGPETHSAIIPPPDHSHAKSSNSINIHHQGLFHDQSKGVTTKKWRWGGGYGGTQTRSSGENFLFFFFLYIFF